jgi:hypothetical protein
MSSLQTVSHKILQTLKPTYLCNSLESPWNAPCMCILS